MPDLNGLLAREQAIRQETEILRDANIALTENLSLSACSKIARLPEQTRSVRQRQRHAA